MSDKIQNESDSPPILKKWSRIYWIVIINLVGWLLIFFLFRKVFE